MRSEAMAQEVLGPNGMFAKLHAGYEHRPAQVQMAEAVAQVFADGGALMVEAGTGTGKSLAYLVAAVASKRRVVISTGTRNLQDQLLHDDLPLLERILGRAIPAVCLKGLSNYLCRRKLDVHLRASRAFDAGHEAQLERIAGWVEETKTGDRAELSEFSEDAPIWGDLCATPETRLGLRCPFHEDCFVTRARRAAKDAQIVVVNHHLFFADLVLRGGPATILPDYEVVLFDEAHQLDVVATTFFGRRVSTRSFDELLRDARHALQLADDLPEGAGEKASPLLSRVEAESNGFFFAIGAVGAASGRSELRQEDLAGDSEDAWYRLDAALEALGLHLSSLPTISEEVLACGRRAESIRQDLGEILSWSHSGSVSWKEVSPQLVAIGYSPVDVSVTLQELLFSSVGAVVLTSATLTVDGSFAFLRERLGVEADELILPSPFDYPRQAALYLPRRAPDPRRDDAVERAVDLVVETVGVVGGGALALFTSYRDMRTAAAALRERFDGVIRIQGERSRRALLDELRAVGERERLILLATASFWEGVDVPGDALRVVAIARLPFASPGDPVVAARLRQLEGDGRSAFLEYQVPQACLALKQGFGRLIRTARDRGVVVLLDGRVRSMSYGETFLRTLPTCTVVETPGELEAWWLGGEESDQ